MAGGGGGRALPETPTWAVAVVCAVIVLVSVAMEHGLHKLGHWFHKREKKAMGEANEKIKAGRNGLASRPSSSLVASAAAPLLAVLAASTTLRRLRRLPRPRRLRACPPLSPPPSPTSSPPRPSPSLAVSMVMQVFRPEPIDETPEHARDGANGHVKLESLEGMRDDGYFIPPYFIGGQQENEHDLSRLCPTIGEEDSDDIPNKVTMSLDGKPADVASSFDLCMTQLKLYMCLMYASVDISEQVGYEKILAVATPRPASFYFSMKYLNKCITAVIDPFTGWLLAIITSNYAAQFRRSDFPYVRLANTVLMKAERKYNELAPDGNLSIPIGIGHLREAVITLADFDGIETPESLFSMAVLVHHIMEPAKIHKAYSLVYKTLSEGARLVRMPHMSGDWDLQSEEDRYVMR
uniref:MLO-like protein n=1 Tax=Oryza glumipatula TaxID=40148 RepID=A0A0D9Z1I4_9ORYZ